MKPLRSNPQHKTQGRSSPRHRRLMKLMLAIMPLWLTACAGGFVSANPAQPELTTTAIFHSALLTAESALAGAQATSLSTPQIESPLAAPTFIPATVEALSISPTPIPIDIAKNLLPTPSQAPAPAVDAVPLPNFSPSIKLPGAQPQIYINNTCQYLQMRWDPNNSAPGTLVVPVMYHSIVGDGKPITDPMHVSEQIFNESMNTAKAYDFEAINMTQFVNFINNNAKIPKRALLNIVDDRKDTRYFKLFFYPYYEAFKWPVVNAWISCLQCGDAERYWQQQAALAPDGWVDYQAHGVVHNMNITGQLPATLSTSEFGEQTSDQFIYSEINEPIVRFEKYLKKRPIAYIWPGGGYSKKGVETARQAGYQAGFTVYQRGPILFNWIPLGEEEKNMGDPRMVLPRYWSSSFEWQLDNIIKIGDEAAAFAAQTRQQETQWYNQYCVGYPPLP